MIRKTEFYGVVVIAVVFLLLVAFSQRDEPQHNKIVKIVRSEFYEDIDDNNNHNNVNFSSIPMQTVLKFQKNFINKTLWDYQFSDGKKLNDFILAAGGKPLRTVVITTWRSGSTFLGDVINSVPGNFYHYEPLLDYGVIQIRGPPYSDSAIKTLKNLFNCDYSNLQNYLEFGKTHKYLFTHNTRLWDVCESFPHLCWNSTFLSQFCKLFPFQSAKIVRLRLKLAEELLRDEKLNVKVLLLVRDPRGTLQSRKHRDWCPGEPDCDKPNLLCADIVSDYEAAVQLSKSYPDRFRAIRYEDLSLDPYNNVEKLFSFFGLFFHNQVKDFLSSHTKHDVGGVSSTFRDSKSAPFHWRSELNFSEVQYIEENCDEAMKLWGYVKAHNESHLREFNPIGRYSIN